jgi:hypothetical protein
MWATLKKWYPQSEWVRFHLGSGINGNLTGIEGIKITTPPNVRFHLGSGINGNFSFVNNTHNFLLVRFHLGSGINGNLTATA